MDLENIFTYHAPNEVQVKQYIAIRKAGLELVKAIVAFVPEGADQSAAIRKVREAVMTANAGIALEGKL